MSISEIPGPRPSNGVSVPRWLGLVVGLLAWLVGVPLAHGVVPWVISRLTPRWGWAGGEPGMWNLLGLIPVSVATACLIWIMILGFAHAAEMPDRVELNWKPKVLLVRGPYAFSRNPMYVAELVLWLGWALFYGSHAVFVGSLVLCAGMQRIVRREEVDLEAQFGDSYRRYKAVIPRWLGPCQHRPNGA
jgi:protein-S-isoprenylcysteine O-methyltransferase Ste14